MDQNLEGLTGNFRALVLVGRSAVLSSFQGAKRRRASGPRRDGERGFHGTDRSVDGMSLSVAGATSTGNGRMRIELGNGPK